MGAGDKHAATTILRTTTPATTRLTTTASQPRAQAVKLTAVGAYDPEGDGHENDDLATQAVDGDPATFWKTEHYTHGFFKGRRPRPRRREGAVDLEGDRLVRQRREQSADPDRKEPERPVPLGIGGAIAERDDDLQAREGLGGTLRRRLDHRAAPAIGEAHVTEVRAVGS